VAGAGVGARAGLFFIIVTPYTWSGGGVGNRYFFSGYGVMLFLLPPVELAPRRSCRGRSADCSSADGAESVLGVVQAERDRKTGPFGMLPVELTLLNDLPVFTEGDARAASRSAASATGDPFSSSRSSTTTPTAREDRSFWTRGDSRADLVFKADRPIRARRSRRGRAGARRRHDHVEGRSTSCSSAERERPTSHPMPEGMPYEKEVEGALSGTCASSTKGGFTPIFFDEHSSDARYLGARIKPMLEPR
jgi:hypothetical protein